MFQTIKDFLDTDAGAGCLGFGFTFACLTCIAAMIWPEIVLAVIGL